MKYYLKYNKETFEDHYFICDYFEEKIHGNDIPKPHLVLEDEKLFRKIKAERGQWFITLNLKLMKKKPIPFYHKWDDEKLEWIIDKELKKEYELKQIDNKYLPILNELKNTFTNAEIYTDNAEAVKEEANSVMQEYITKKQSAGEKEKLTIFKYERKFCPICGTKLVNRRCPKCRYPE